MRDGDVMSVPLFHTTIVISYSVWLKFGKIELVPVHQSVAFCVNISSSKNMFAVQIIRLKKHASGV